MTPVLVVGAQTAGLGVVRTLGRRGVPVVVLHYKATDVAHRSRYATEAASVTVPDRDEARFVADLLALADHTGGGLLVPTADEAVVAVSRHRAVLAERFTVACTPWDVTETFIEKRRTYALAEALGVACPQTVVPTAREEVLAYAATAAFPCLVKPSRGDQFVARFGEKMFLVADRHELIARYDLAAAAGCEVILQEFVGGPDDTGVNYNSYWWDGAPLVEFTAAKLRGGPPFVGSPRVLVSRRVPDVIEPGRAILRAMRFSGYACTEFKRDARDGRYKLMEVNGRHNLSTALAVHCGIDFPWLQYRHLVHGELPAPAAFAEGVYWIDLLRDVGYSLTRFRAERHTLREYLRPYVGPHVYAIPRWGDLGPFARELWGRWSRRRRRTAAGPVLAAVTAR
jgi:predicted ATP-grasp superfamily ATP-dependent carboligase